MAPTKAIEHWKTDKHKIDPVMNKHSKLYVQQLEEQKLKEVMRDAQQILEEAMRDHHHGDDILSRTKM